MDKIAVYHSLPIWLQNIACSYEGARLKKRRYNRTFFQLLDEYKRRGDYNEDLLARYRDEQLHAFVMYAAEAVPYYRNLFTELKINPSDIRTLGDLSRLPILTKDIVQEHLDELKSEEIPANEMFIHHTSGTTGKGLTFPVTFEAEKHQWAVWWRYRLKHKIDFGIPCGIFTGQPVVSPKQRKKPFWRFNRPNNEIIYSGYHLNEKNIPYYIEHLLQSNVRWLHGYPSNLALLAAYVVQRRIDFNGQIKFVTTGAESLLSHQKKLIQRAFGCKVRNHYGLAEGVANISECPEGKMHIDEDYAAVELVPQGDGSYAVVGTNVTNQAFPLIRYDTGDIVYLSQKEQGCLCGNPGRVVTSIDGRIEDYLLLKDGTRLGRMDHLFKDMVRIKEAQLVQKQAGNVIFRIVRAPEYNEADEQQLMHETRRRLGDALSVEFDYVREIEKSPRGKLRFVVNETKQADHPLELNL